MRRNAHYPRYHRCPRPEVPAPRRGNSIVLVMGILVLLVIIATAFITRTHAGRVTANAMVRSALRDDNARVIAEMLAQEIALALFPQPVNDNPVTGDPEVLDGFVADSNFPRLSPLHNPIRYGVDQDVDGDGLPDFPYNFAPYTVVPYTNWPDVSALPNPHAQLWPAGPGNTGPGAGDASPFLAFEGNGVGNPGFSDARWLADIEPLRKDTNGDGVLDAYSQWRHMTNIARPNNGWRIVGNISDVEASLVTDLKTPVEQWLASILPANAQAGNPDAALPAVNIFEFQWGEWFVFDSHQEVHFGALDIPANFYNLSDLDANGFIHDDPLGDRPQDEFIAGTARWNVGRVLADTDGDGFTDAFWFLAPTMTERGIRQIVAVRIIDNSAMLNVNVATRFDRLNTTGATPADLALVGQLASPGFGDTWNVGFYDYLANWFVGPDNDQDGQPDYETGYELPDPNENSDVDFPWLRHVVEVGLLDTNGDPILMPDQQTRLAYWREAGRLGFAPQVGSVLTPFNLADELELRMFHGNNYPWIFSRYEFTTQSVSADLNEQFLRASPAREESSEYLDQLGNRELVFDHRKQLTMYNGARNDEMPPWMWWRWDLPPGVPSGGVEADRFFAQTRTKLDLREPDNLTFLDGAKSFAERLAPTLLLAFLDGDETEGMSYFGEYDAGNLDDLTNARLAAAGLAANILQWRDDDPLADPPLNLADAVPLPGIPGTPGIPQDDTIRMLGMERQPFLVEAFIAHVYGRGDVPLVLGGGNTVPPNPDTPMGAPEFVGVGEGFVDETSEQTTIVVVQIANPYGNAIDDLSQYKLSVYGQQFQLSGTLGLTTEEEPRTAIVYSIDNSFDGDTAFGDNWRNFLDIHATDLFGTPADTLLLDASLNFSKNIDDYDSMANEAVKLIRVIDGVDVIVDRIDNPHGPAPIEFLAAVNSLNAVPYVPPGAGFDTGLGQFNGIRIGDNDYFVVWARAGRVWGYDFDMDGQIAANERNPRYVFSVKPAPDLAVGMYTGEEDGAPLVYLGDAYETDQPPDGQPWIDRGYVDPSGVARMRKPTFFPTKTVYDELGQAVYQPFDSPPPIGTVHFADNGVKAQADYFFPFSLQMLQKDGDFEQVGELLNVWMFGHELAFGPGDIYVGTTETFSEFMIDDRFTNNNDPSLVNRLRLEPTEVAPLLGQVVGKPLTGNTDPMYLLDFQHAVPALPAGARVLDAFVCDGPGVNSGGAGEFLNANRFTGKMTPGMININTAPVEVMRAAPHMARLVHEDNPPANNPFVRVPEAIVQYRERFNGLPPTDPNTTGTPNGADYSDRDDVAVDLRPERGIASIGELMLLTEPASFPDPPPPLEPNDNWQINFAGLDPFTTGLSTQISTDVNDVFDPNLPGDVPDEVAEDAEESNLLFAGMSNMITTRSDVFTVYFKVRSFIQNPTTGVWDATNPEFIVDDSRYVMLVDRSEVNHPNDKPKILYLEKLPK